MQKNVVCFFTFFVIVLVMAGFSFAVVTRSFSVFIKADSHDEAVNNATVVLRETCRDINGKLSTDVICRFIGSVDGEEGYSCTADCMAE